VIVLRKLQDVTGLYLEGPVTGARRAIAFSIKTLLRASLGLSHRLSSAAGKVWELLSPDGPQLCADFGTFNLHVLLFYLKPRYSFSSA
jgi:hypothetical protein